MSNLVVGQLVRTASNWLGNYGNSWTWYGDIPTPRGETEVEIKPSDTFIVERIDNSQIYVHHLKSGLRMIPIHVSTMEPIG